MLPRSQAATAGCRSILGKVINVVGSVAVGDGVAVETGVGVVTVGGIEVEVAVGISGVAEEAIAVLVGADVFVASVVGIGVAVTRGVQAVSTQVSSHTNFFIIASRLKEIKAKHRCDRYMGLLCIGKESSL